MRVIANSEIDATVSTIDEVQEFLETSNIFFIGVSELGSFCYAALFGVKDGNYSRICALTQ